MLKQLFTLSINTKQTTPHQSFSLTAKQKKKLRVVLVTCVIVRTGILGVEVSRDGGAFWGKERLARNGGGVGVDDIRGSECEGAKG